MSSNSNHRLAYQATVHCLTGCGIGDILGVVIATLFGLSYINRIEIGIILGFILGFSFGIIPLIKSNMSFIESAKVILAGEIFSILAMEAAEALTEFLFPGMRRSGILHTGYWLGLIFALFAGFIAAYPVNLYLVKKGVRHHH